MFDASKRFDSIVHPAINKALTGITLEQCIDLLETVISDAEDRISAIESDIRKEAERGVENELNEDV